ncbi:MAG: hypothetical protein HUU37_07245 [Bdellovibrionales bacterium]|nr:hypothetical protein [Bdellovibrionales bacterium]
MKTIEFQRDPSVLAFMARALVPKWGRRSVPRMELIRRGYVLGDCRELFALCGLPASDELPRWFPLVLGFRLVMRAVTDPAFPEPIWSALQVRNSIRQRAPVRAGMPGEYRLTVGEARSLGQGLEVDFVLRFLHEGEEIWGANVTFYWRKSTVRGLATGERILVPAPGISGRAVEVVFPRGGGVRYGGISGDYNGIHLTDTWARLFGFPSAFLHPHRLLGVMQERIGSGPGELRVWFRGPVPYGARAELHLGGSAGFLHLEPSRPAIVAEWG